MQPAAWSLQDWLAAACGEIVKVWHPHDAKQEVKIYEGTNVYAADFSSNNKVLAVAGDKGQITLYSSKTHDTGSRAVGHFPNPLEVGVESFSCVRFAANDSSLVAGCHNGTVHTWALKVTCQASTAEAVLSLATAVTECHDAVRLYGKGAWQDLVVWLKYPEGAYTAMAWLLEL